MLKIRDVEKFSLEIEALVQSKQMSYMEAILEYCQYNGLEYETIAKMLTMNTRLKGKLKTEAYDLNLLRGKKPVKLEF